MRQPYLTLSLPYPYPLPVRFANIPQIFCDFCYPICDLAGDLAKCSIQKYRRHTDPQQIKRRKWRWLGHALRKPADNVTRRGLRWAPQGKRKREWPKTTWQRSTEAEAKAAGLRWGQLERKAQDRGGGGGDGEHWWTTYVPYGTTGIKSNCHTDPNGRYDQTEIKRNKRLDYFKQNCPIFRFAIQTFLRG